MEIAVIPRKLVSKLICDPDNQIHLNILLSSLLLFILATLLVFGANVLGLLPHVCLAQSLIGIPCPGCGVTRSVLAFLAGDVSRAWSLNPGGPVLCATVAVQVPLRSMALCGLCGTRTARLTSRAMTTFVLVILFVNWLNNFK